MSETQKMHLSNLKDICRCCHANGSFKSLKEPYKFRGQVEVYYIMLIETFGMLISPPTIEASYTICDDCIIRLRDSTKFRNQVEACEEKFNEYYSQLLQKSGRQTDNEVLNTVAVHHKNDSVRNVYDELKKENIYISATAINGTNVEYKLSNDDEEEDDVEEQGHGEEQDHVEDCELDNLKYQVENIVITGDIDEEFDNLGDDINNVENARDPLTKNFNKIKNENLFDCVLCTKKYISKDLLKIHFKEHLNKQSKCNDCGQSYGNLTRLKIHYRNKHNKTISFDEELSTHTDKKKLRVKVVESEYKNHLKKHDEETECIKCEVFDSKNLLNKNLKKYVDEKYKCDYCGQQFLRKDSLKTHISIHMKYKEGYKCQKCNSFVVPKLMAKHSCIKDKNGVQKVKLSNYLECRFCKKRVREVCYDRHLKSHVGKTECINCSKIFESIDLLKEHSKEHKYQNMFTCDICEKRFIRRSTLKRHIDFHHMGKGRKFMCHECGLFFNDISNLRAHTTTVHQKLRMFQCSICQKKLASKKSLKVHIRTHTGERPYVCDECGDCFICFTRLKIHRIKHDVIKKHGTKYVCKICHTGFSGQTMLTNHVKSEHPGHYPININKYKRKYLPCPSCKKVFSQKFSLDRHISKHGDIVKVPCEICNKLFIDKFSLARHMKNIHTPKEKVTKEKVQCSLCKRKVHDIENHMTVHTVRPMKCKACGKNYPDAAVLHRHIMNVHHDVNKIFQCKKCDRRPYSRKENLRIHMLKKHGCDLNADEE